MTALHQSSLNITALDTDTDTLQARDRVLLYTRGMDVGAVASLKLALGALRRAENIDPTPRTAESAQAAVQSVEPTNGTPALPVPPERVMRELFSLLHESGMTTHLQDPSGERLQSMPPLNRRYMIAEPLKTRGLRHRILSRLLNRKEKRP